MKARFLIFLFLQLFILTSAYGQVSRLDSLKNELSICNGKACLDLVVSICWASRKDPIDSVKKYVAFGENLVKDYPDALSEIDLQYILVLEQHDNEHYIDGIETAKNALPLALAAQDTLRIFGFYRMLMTMYSKQASNTEVVNIASRWKSLADSLNLPKRKAQAHSQLANYYRNQGQNEKSLIEVDKAIEIFQNLEDDYGLHLAYLRKGLAFSNLGDDVTNLDFLYKSFEVYGPEMNAGDSALINNNIGRALRKLKRYKEGEPYLLSSIRQGESVGWRGNTIHSSNELMDLYYEDNQLEKALKIGEEAYSMSENYQNIRGKIDIARNLSEIYAAVGKYDKAYELKLEHSLLVDSLYDLEADATFAETDAKYKVVEKDKALAEQALEIEKRNSSRRLLIAILVSLALIACGIYLWMRQRLKLKQREKEKLEEIDQLKTDFFANVSHELRTPLTLINGPINQVLEETQNANHKKLMQLAVKNSNKLRHLINQLLDFSKVEAGKVKISRKVHDINTFAKGILMSFESLAEKRGVKLQFFSYNHELPLSFDGDMMEKILSNLLSNALKFTKSNGEVKLITAEKGDQIEIVVQDTGVGIGEEQLPYIFDRFYQAGQSISKEYDGTGIGLSLVKDLVELHGGEVEVSSALGKGSSFTILLPKVESQNQSNQEIQLERLYPSVSPESMISEEMVVDKTEKQESANLPKLLIIEDNQDVSFFIAQQLYGQFQIVEANDGEAGVEMALTESPDLIICDIMMPKKNGYEVTKELKSQVETSHIPIILLTAKATREEKLLGLSQGADDYLIKPFDSKELQLRTNNLVQNAQKIRSYVKDHLVTESTTIVKNSVDKQFFESVYKVLNENLMNEQFGVDEFAKKVGMSPTNLNRKLRALSDQSSNQFIQSFRLKKAAELLTGKTGNVSEIAMEVGFSSTSYFIKVFKAKYGMTPNEFMNKNLE